MEDVKEVSLFGPQKYEEYWLDDFKIRGVCFGIVNRMYVFFNKTLEGEVEVYRCPVEGYIVDSRSGDDGVEEISIDAKFEEVMGDCLAKECAIRIIDRIRCS